MKFIGGVTLFILLIFLSAFTAQHLWLWFIVPLGVKALGMAHAYGIAVIISYLKINVHRTKTGSFGEAMGAAAIANSAVLLVGYLTSLVM